MSLRELLTSHWRHIQDDLFPWLEKRLGHPLGERHQLLVKVLPRGVHAALARLVWAAAPRSERPWRSFVVFNLTTTRLLIEYLGADKSLRRLCRWTRTIPSEST